VYVVVINIFRNEKKVNVFRVKDLKIYESGVQSQREELPHILKHLLIIKDQEENICYD
jgi:hypothetical protein